VAPTITPASVSINLHIRASSLDFSLSSFDRARASLALAAWRSPFHGLARSAVFCAAIGPALFHPSSQTHLVKTSRRRNGPTGEMIPTQTARRIKYATTPDSGFTKAVQPLFFMSLFITEPLIHRGNLSETSISAPGIYKGRQNKTRVSNSCAHSLSRRLEGLNSLDPLQRQIGALP
jgi:hypothetical protein